MKRTNTGGTRPGAEGRREPARRLLELAGSGGLEDAETQKVAEEAVRRARSEAPKRKKESAALTPEEVREKLGVRRAAKADPR